MEMVLGVAGVLALAWIGLALALLIARPRTGRLGEFVRLMPDIVRLIHRLMRDPTVPASIKVRIALLLGYLALPIDLIPDFIPLLGYADDAIIAAMVLRSVLRGVGREKVGELWPGSPGSMPSCARQGKAGSRELLTVPHSLGGNRLAQIANQPGVGERAPERLSD